MAGLCQAVFMAAAAAYGFYRSMAAFVILLIPAMGYLRIYEQSWQKRRLLCLVLKIGRASCRERV